MNMLKREHTALLLIACFIFFTMALPIGILNAAWTYIQVSYGVSLDSLGVLLFAGTCGALIGTFFSGRLIGRFGMGRYLSTGSVVMVLGLFGYTIAPSWIALIATAFLTTLGFSVFNAGLNTFVSSNYSTGQLNWLHAAYALGTTVGPTMATLIVEQANQSWHLSYAVVCVLMIGIAVVIFTTRDRWTLPTEDDTLNTIPGQAIKRANIWESLRLPAVLIGMTLFFVNSGVIAGTGQLSKTLLTARNIAGAGYWISLYWAFFFFGRVIMGFVASRLNNAMLLRTCMIGMGIGAGLLWQHSSDTLNLVGLALVGFSAAPIFPTLVAETRRNVSLAHRPNAIGFQLTASALGSSIIPGAMAWLAEHSSVDLIGALPVVGIAIVLALYEFSLRRREAHISSAPVKSVQ